MANVIIFTSLLRNKALHVLGLLCLFLLIQRGVAYEFKVGGSKGWAPSDANAYNQWAESKRFQIGDTLVFDYAADQDSVLYVTKDDYTNCNTANPIQKYNDGHTVYKFNQSGPHYFISGVADHCHQNEKLLVVVLADRTNKTGNSPPPPESIPSPAPEGQASPSPPSDITPSPPKHKNAAASSSIMSVACSLGAFIGSSLLLVF